jgi:hypothetical protein
MTIKKPLQETIQAVFLDRPGGRIAVKAADTYLANMSAGKVLLIHT